MRSNGTSTTCTSCRRCARGRPRRTPTTTRRSIATPGTKPPPSVGQRPLPQNPDAAQDLLVAQRGSYRGQVGAPRRPGQQDPDDLGRFPDGATVGGRVLLVDLLARREPEVGREPADLVEPVEVRRGRLVAAREGPGQRGSTIKKPP